MNLKLNDKYKVKILSQENEGLGVAKIENFVVFVENGLPGETGTIVITEVKKKYGRARMIELNGTSIERQTPPCPYFNECGGCDLQHQKYEYQLIFKKGKVKTCLKHIGGFDEININDVISINSFNYRNKITLKVDKNIVGFYKRNSNEIIDIDYCMISNSNINEALKTIKYFIKKHDNSTFKEIMIRDNNGIMISVECQNEFLSNEFASYILSSLSNVKSILINKKVLYGTNCINENINNYNFKLSPTSFFQINYEVMTVLYNKIISYISDQKYNAILDLYCGVVTITSLISKYANKVIGIEMNMEAVMNANENKKINKVDNIVFIDGKVEKVIDRIINEKIDVVIMDPPRSGVDIATLDTIINIKPQKMIYVSCNPSTLAET